MKVIYLYLIVSFFSFSSLIAQISDDVFVTGHINGTGKYLTVFDNQMVSFIFFVDYLPEQIRGDFEGYQSITGYSTAKFIDNRVHFEIENFLVDGKAYKLKLIIVDADLKNGLAYSGKKEKLHIASNYRARFKIGI